MKDRKFHLIKRGVNHFRLSILVGIAFTIIYGAVKIGSVHNVAFYTSMVLPALGIIALAFFASSSVYVYRYLKKDE
jgi:hypothetical protein